VNVGVVGDTAASVLDPVARTPPEPTWVSRSRHVPAANPWSCAAANAQLSGEAEVVSTGRPADDEPA
jgi:hypothetical protein